VSETCGEDKEGRQEMDKPLLMIAGTRPEAIKLCLLFKCFRRLNVDIKFVWSGQHYDYELSKVFFEQLGLPDLT